MNYPYLVTLDFDESLADMICLEAIVESSEVRLVRSRLDANYNTEDVYEATALGVAALHRWYDVSLTPEQFNDTYVQTKDPQ